MPSVVQNLPQLLAACGPRVFVSDFDGTMTSVDFFDVVLHHVPPEQMPDYWARCEAGELTHVEALHGIFQAAPHDRQVLESWLPETRLDPAAFDAIDRLQAAGWQIVVVSAGSEWYIREILKPANESVMIVANPGDVVGDRGLTMGWPAEDSGWYSRHFGVHKGQLVQSLRSTGRTVAFAGDGRPDVTAAAAVEPELRFARSWLAEQLRRDGLSYRPFEKWSEIADALLRNT